MLAVVTFEEPARALAPLALGGALGYKENYALTGFANC